MIFDFSKWREGSEDPLDVVDDKDLFARGAVPINFLGVEGCLGQYQKYWEDVQARKEMYRGGSVSKLNNVTSRVLDRQYSKWAEFLNGVIGVLAFTLGISCLGTPYPSVTGFVSLLFLVAVMSYGRKHFPKKLRELRQEELSEEDEAILKDMEKKYFGVMSTFKNFSVYLIGWGFLLAVAMYGFFV